MKIEVLRDNCAHLEQHLRNIERAWNYLQDALKNDKIWDEVDIYSVMHYLEEHDLSKCNAEEFVPYAEFFHGTHGKNFSADKYGNSSFAKERHDKVVNTFKAAWEHHKDNNPHHWQNWTAKDGKEPRCELLVHLICMIVDWIAMSYQMGDTAEEYYVKNKDWILLPEWAHDEVQRIFKKINEYERA